ncbi:proline dehydrogenase family protein [Pleomorphovibrio marinus]|uniref:proline dehydrogenase family protein n=1 Tax=Pleomorphovibrio marinus TaxID=2164132 RepID=UPI000E0AB610|nr:proline dehydrogenase family protein [Pleomorphovibrio marinus]
MNPKPNVSFENTEVAYAHKSDRSLRKSCRLYWWMHFPILLEIGIFLTNLGLKLGLPIKGIIRENVFRQFCGGESVKDCQPVIDELAEYGVGAILDYSVEGKTSEESYTSNEAVILETIKSSKGDERIPFTVFKVSGLGDTALLEKKQQGAKLNSKEEKALISTKSRVLRLFEAAFEAKVRIMVDAEESWFQDVVDEWVDEGMARYNKDTAIVYNSYQMYRRDMLSRLKSAHMRAVAHGYYLGVKLVRGAYLEKENKRAHKKGYPSPIQTSKADTDKDFDTSLQFCINNKQRIYFICGTHNELSNTILTELIDLHGMQRNDERIYFAQLYGMSDHVSFNLANAGFNVAKYLPFGPLAEVLPYLSRRIDENTAIAGQSSREYKKLKAEIKRRKDLPKFPKIA